MHRPAGQFYLSVCAAVVFLGTAQGQSQPTQNQNDAELTSHETPATFRAKVNLVLVPVVVRDKQGRAVGNLQKDDFQVLDRGKPQIISSFSVETLAGEPPSTPRPASPSVLPDSKAPVNPADMPNRFVAYLFDDVHISIEDLMLVRKAAGRNIDESLAATDRAAVFTTSGQNTLDFTDDRGQLHQALLHLSPHPLARATTQLCPDVSYYEAHLIMELNDPTALQAATANAMACMQLDPTDPNSVRIAQNMARAVASQVFNSGEEECRASLRSLREVVRRISAMPGQRIVIMVSPGFLTFSGSLQDKSDVIDHAIRANVIISSLNARGLYTVIPFGDASQPSPQSMAGAMMRSTYVTASASMEEDVLAEVALGTGGVFFHNNNDLFAGFERTAARPEFLYVLGFSPQNLKLDGRFHALKVVLRNSSKLELQARRGYYAPQHLADPQDTAKQEIQDALFSREELRDIPVEVHTQFFKSSEENARLTVLARVDVRRLPFRKENGRNRDDLTVVSGLFDRNGNLVTSNSKTVAMRLKDQTLETRLSSGITLKSSFDLKSGSYLIRLVVRDSEGQLMAAANGTVDIPLN